MVEVDKRQGLKLKIEIASYIGRATPPGFHDTNGHQGTWLRQSYHMLQGNIIAKKKKPPYDPYDGRKRLLTDGFNGIYTLVYRPVAESS